MGYPVQANAPRIVINGRTLAVGAFDWPNLVGQMFKVGIYEQSANGEWLELSGIVMYSNEGDCLKDMQAKGGSVQYMIWLKNAVNAAFAKLFSAAPIPPSGEPKTDGEAKGYIVSAVNGWKITNVNGVPVVG